MPRVWLLALAGLLALGTPACDLDDLDLLVSLGQEVGFSESPNPDVRAMGEALEQEKNQEMAVDAYGEFLQTGDSSQLHRAIDLQPENPDFRAMALTEAMLYTPRGSGQYLAAKDQLLRAEAMRARALGLSLSPAEVEMRALRTLVTAQAALLDQLEPGWTDIPPHLYNPRAHLLFQQHCRATGTLGIQDEQCGSLQS